MTAALILGGGAPNLTLMSGALAAFKERNAQFSAISASGAGMLVALLYAAPKDTDPLTALRNTRNMGVVDPINAWFPFNYKVFQKPGPLADWYRKVLNPFLNHLPQRTFAEQWVNDLAWLAASTITPSNVWPLSGGLSAPAPWLEDVVDFKKLKEQDYDFYINAFNLTTQEMDTFEKKDITADHFRAALAFPFIYPPFKMKHKYKSSEEREFYYIEGSAVDTFNFKSLLRDCKIQEKKPITKLIVFDIIGEEDLLHPPTDLYDAWVQSIMVPLVAMAKDDLKIFDKLHRESYGLDLKRIEFGGKIDWKSALRWSRSNLENLFDIGYKAGQKFCDDNPDILPQPQPSSRPRPDVRVVSKAS